MRERCQNTPPKIIEAKIAHAAVQMCEFPVAISEYRKRDEYSMNSAEQ
jgi:hypothetical protein